jgi:hypothetical protein
MTRVFEITVAWPPPGYLGRYVGITNSYLNARRPHQLTNQRSESQMERLKLAADDEQILAVVDRWADLLAAGDYDGAFGMTYHPPDDEWTPQMMKTWINGYGFDEPLSDGRVMEVTPRETAVPIDVEPEREIMRPNPDAEPPKVTEDGHAYGSYESLLNAQDGLLGEVWYTLPLNGEWSDLVARFQLANLKGYLILVLTGLDVP